MVCGQLRRVMFTNIFRAWDIVGVGGVGGGHEQLLGHYCWGRGPIVEDKGHY